MRDNEMSGRERRALAVLDAYEYMLNLDGVSLESRLRSVPNGWRDFQLLRTVARRLIKSIESTCSEKDLRIVNRWRGGEIVVRERSAVEPSQSVTIDRKTLKALTGLIVENACSICINNEAEIRGCKVRKILNIVDPIMDPPAFGCGYADRLENLR